MMNPTEKPKDDERRTKKNLTVIAATALVYVVTPALIQSASAIRVDEPAVVDTGCNDPKFADKPQFQDSCPRASEDSSGVGETGEREDVTTCTARNPGQEAKLCPDDADETIIINPPS
jgi:hypothetical protein